MAHLTTDWPMDTDIPADDLLAAQDYFDGFMREAMGDDADARAEEAAYWAAMDAREDAAAFQIEQIFRDLEDLAGCIPDNGDDDGPDRAEWEW